MLASLIGRIVALCSRRFAVTILVFAVLALGSIWGGVAHLGVTTDTGGMFAATLPWKQRNAALTKLFPQNDNTLVAVIRSDIPEEGLATARALTAVLSKDHEHFLSVTNPADDPAITREGLLFLDKPQLQSLLDSTVAAQPFLGTLNADPTARGVFQTLGLIGQGLQTGQADLTNFGPELNGFATALKAAADGHPAYLSWQNMLASQLSGMAGQYHFVVAKPRLDYSSLQPGGPASDAMRHAINALPYVREGVASAMITGEVQLSDEEFATVAHGMTLGLIVSLALVAAWLVLAVQSWRAIVPILITLVTGLVLTTGFAALSVGTLNLISVAFAILFVGIAVDFAIQFTVRFRAQRLADGSLPDRLTALERTGEETGQQILVAALATAAGFLAFTPTSFIGVAQLGLIAGFGMLIAFATTLTLLPALLNLCGARIAHRPPGFARARGLDHALRRYRVPTLGVFGLLALLGLILIPRLHFDADPLHTKNPNSEGMRALHLLEADPINSPYGAELLAPNVQTASEWAAKLEALPSVANVIWIGALVPSDQKTKIAMIEDTASILLPTIAPSAPASPPDAASLRAAASDAAQKLGAVLDKMPQDSPLRTIQSALAQLAKAPDQQILMANDRLTRFLPGQLDELRDVLAPKPMTMADVPLSLARDYLLPDGRALLSIHPKGQMSANSVLHRFVAELRSVNPDVGGAAIEITESAHTITHAFTVAALSALVMIAVILLAALRRILDVSLVLAPLVLASLMTVIIIVGVPETLNYANIIALPLLLGVGVSFNIYFVMNWRAGVRGPLESPTARAVLFSALTTGTAFGSLAASAHPGTASMGRLLLMSLGCTLLATLLFVPALLPKRSIDTE
ncbi:MMPL family transporter [Tanticharoenia sakaeratensis]|uniref:Hopanoid biosynthesis associated RND transporter-like protein HpnN n=1 Tax=Tanticharoenia sakaeratensis NBRC 103193 TaxID=1231623 RepID=A0A0D6MLK0_9PROT|nr:MMPL family transporter [Tanticharoenia sakaeratensis]GAN54547.1 hopanoid biosynthesis associated RND transporter-like protein HpnN [Tanticharoenia sakaeratensis NBRC 103193]GBQ24465.1 hypothetical protein AA103193_2762 [Tanticharoenia sakaeratensis NBRC 103193]